MKLLRRKNSLMKALRLSILFVFVAVLLSSISLLGAQDMAYNEAPMLAEMVAAGELPPVAERLPAEPMVVEPHERIGVYGGTWHLGLSGGGDGAHFVRTIAYESLVRWNLDWTEVVPNIAESWEANDEGTEYTFHLREGIKWSDGAPFTSADILFWYESHATNTEINPGGPPSWMRTGDDIGVVTAPDDYTVTFSFAAPNGLFLQRLATPDGRQPTQFARHWAEQFHIDHNPDGIEALMSEAGVETWVDLWNLKVAGNGEWTTPSPKLWPWVLAEGSGYTADATQVTAVRNPYYWKVDPEGNQYPYIDTVQFFVGEVETLVLRALNGDISFQDRHIASLANKAVFFDNQEAGGYHFFETIPSSMNTTVIALNLTHLDPVKREIFQNKDFRIGLSHAIDRQALIDLIYVGQGEPYQLAPRPTSPFYHEQLAKQYTEYDVDLANQHLDAAGYTERDADGFRLGPDGNRISFTIDTTAALNSEAADLLEQVIGYWAEVGIEAQLNVVDRTLLYERKEANQHDVVIWGGDGGLDVILEPRWYFPYSNESNFAEAWQYWYNNSSDPRAEEPSAAAQRQMELYDEIKATADPERQAELMNEILDIAAEEFYAIGINLTPPGYGIQKNNFFNVPPSFPGAWLYPNPAPANTFQFFIEGDA